MLRQTDNLENIVNVILESASVETGAVLVQSEELVLSEFLDELKTKLRRRCRQFGRSPRMGLSGADAGGEVRSGKA